jgi:nitrous-oxide reductase
MSRRTPLQRLIVCLSAGLFSVSALAAETTLQEVMKQRGLADKDVLAAAKTYTPAADVMNTGLQLGRTKRPGDRTRNPLDAHSHVHRGLHAGTLAGLRLRRRVQRVLAEGRIDGKDINYGDTRHPALSGRRFSL